MAKYNVDHACGHTQTHQLVGPHKERDRKLAWLEGQPCSECYQAQLAADRAAAGAKAIEDAAAAGLPDLEGTPKQVAWAAQVRADTIRRIDESVEGMRRRAAGRPDRIAAYESQVRIVHEAVRERTSAAWWIDHRPEDLMMEVLTPSHIERIKALNPDLNRGGVPS